MNHPTTERIVEVRRICRDDEANALLKAGWLLLDVGSRQWTEAYGEAGGKRTWIALKDVVYVLGWREEAERYCPALEVLSDELADQCALSGVAR